MDKRKKVNFELDECPNCKALCLVGNDEDDQVYCAKCGRSFKKSKTPIKLSEEEYKQLVEKATKIFTNIGWTAYQM